MWLKQSRRQKGKDSGREAVLALQGFLSFFEKEAEMLSRSVYLRLRGEEGIQMQCWESRSLETEKPLLLKVSLRNS